MASTGHFRRGPVRRREAPPAQQILALKQRADLEAGPIRDRWEIIRSVRNRTHRIAIPEQYRKTTTEIRTHWIEDILRRVVAHLTLNSPAVTVSPSGPGDDKQRNATLREKWSNSVLLELDAKSAPNRFSRAVMDHAASYGQGILKAVVVNSEWADYPTARRIYGRAIGDLDDGDLKKLERRQEEYKLGRLPFHVAAVDPRSWWGFYSQRRLRECIEVSARTVADVIGEYDVDPGLLSEPYVEGHPPHGYGSPVLWIEHWNDTYVSYLANGVLVDQWKHGYGRVPYFPFYGLSNQMGEPGQQMMSVVEHVVDLVRLLDQTLTQWANWAHMAAFPMGMLVGPEKAGPLSPDGAGETQMGPDFTFEPGVFRTLPPGWRIEWVAPPPVGRDLVGIFEILRSFINEIVPNVLRGVGTGDQAGYAISQLITAAKLVYDPISENAALAYQEMVKFIWWLVEHKIGERVYVWGENPIDGKSGGRSWLGLGPDDIAGYYACTVNIAPLLPNTRISEGQFGLQQTQAGAISMQTHRQEFLHLPYPEEEQDQIWVEQELNDPQSPARQMMRDRALKRAGLLDELERQQREAELAAMPLPPGIEQRLTAGGEGGAPAAAGPGTEGVPGPTQLAPTPGLGGMPLVPPEPTGPGIPAGMAGPGGPPQMSVPGAGFPSGMPGGRAAGVERQPPMQPGPGPGGA